MGVKSDWTASTIGAKPVSSSSVLIRDVIDLGEESGGRASERTSGKIRGEQKSLCSTCRQRRR